jgi:hypothetical protein
MKALPAGFCALASLIGCKFNVVPLPAHSEIEPQTAGTVGTSTNTADPPVWVEPSPRSTDGVPPLRRPDGGLALAGLDQPPTAGDRAGQPAGRSGGAPISLVPSIADADAGTGSAGRGAAGHGTARSHDGGTASHADCSGAAALGLCWYLGSAGQSCGDVCAAHGSFDDRANGIVGTSSQGGTLQSCGDVMRALGYAAPTEAYVRFDAGLGCHIWSDGSTYWLDDPSPPFNATASRIPGAARLACACLR